MKIYLVDDDYVFSQFLRETFPDVEFEHFMDGYSFFAAMERERPDRVIVDLHFDKIPEEKLISRIPAREGLVIAKRVKEAYPGVPVLLVSRVATAEDVRELRRLNIPFLDGLASPENAERKLKQFFGFINEKESQEKLLSTKRLLESYGFFTNSKFILQELADVVLYPERSKNILIVGETGTGKTFLARTLHKINFPSGAPYQELNLTRIPENLIESELFGYEKGAFTGAYRSKAGYLEMANGGTLFIDEIGTLTYQQQGKLLNAIEGGVFSRVGGSSLIRANARIIGATSSDPAKELREDLLYRFSGIIYLPPLKERREDVQLFLEKYQMEGLRLTRSAERFLAQADFPGNLRMLLNVLDTLKARGGEATIDEAIKAYEKWTPDMTKSVVFEKEGREIQDHFLEELYKYLEENSTNLKHLEEALLSYLLGKGLKMEKIASLLGVSRATVFRLKEKLEKK